MTTRLLFVLAIAGVASGCASSPPPLASVIPVTVILVWLAQRWATQDETAFSR